jgi:hypothetical protein
MTDKLEEHDDIIEVFTDYRIYRSSHLEDGHSRDGQDGVYSGRGPSDAQGDEERENIIDIRGYSKQPPHLLKASRILRRND